jgi:hypothetical protein
MNNEANLEGWIYYGNKIGRSHHIAPDNDLISHSVDADMSDKFICACDPRLDADKDIILHHAMDARPNNL